jgi:hypothetical protein
MELKSTEGAKNKLGEILMIIRNELRTGGSIREEPIDLVLRRLINYVRPQFKL